MEICLKYIALNDFYRRTITEFLFQVLGQCAIDLYRDEPPASFNENVS